MDLNAERAITLLKAAHCLLKQCDEGPYDKNALEVEVAYDETTCDGYCLMEDIGYLLEESGIEIGD